MAEEMLTIGHKPADAFVIRRHPDQPRLSRHVLPAALERVDDAGRASLLPLGAFKLPRFGTAESLWQECFDEEAR